MWLKMLVRPCTFSEAPRTITIQPRMAETIVRNSSSMPKPSASTSSRSRSAPTRAWSTTHCMNSGPTTANTSIARARASNCPSERRSPTTRPSIERRRMRSGSFAGASSPTGVNSSATPVKCLDTAAIGTRRTPTAGS